MLRTVLLGLALLGLGFAPAPFLEKKKPLSDLERIQGVWFQSKTSTELRVQGDSFTYYRDGKVSIAYTIKLNETTEPRQYDLVGPGKTDKLMFRGIYAWDGETLKMTSAGVSRPRPTSFDTPGNQVRFFRRQRP